MLCMHGSTHRWTPPHFTNPTATPPLPFAAAALDGGGVLLGHAALLGRHLHEGSLVAPMGRVTDTGRHLAILLPEQPAGVVSAVAAWLEQAATA